MVGSKYEPDTYQSLKPTWQRKHMQEYCFNLRILKTKEKAFSLSFYVFTIAYARSLMLVLMSLVLA